MSADRAPDARRGGDQIIPRPVGWRPGDAAPWTGRVPRQRIELDPLLTVVAARGPGRGPAWSSAQMRASAVLIVLVDGPYGAEVVLTKRATHLSSHRGEMSFPGGRLDAGETPVDAALREADEEVGLDPSAVTVVGELDHQFTLSSESTIVPIVGRLDARPALRPMTREVDRILFVPLVDLVRPGTHREERWGLSPDDPAIHFFELDDETVWGATARMLVQLVSLAVGVES